MTRLAAVPVAIETGVKRTFACAIDWPGWCRSARTEDLALDTLASYAPRYAPVAGRAGIPFPDRFDLTVTERVPGTATTDFGAPDARLPGDTRTLTAQEADRLVALMHAGWAQLDVTAARAPGVLRKGPRGGGRDRDAMLEHVLSAEHAYARKLGMRVAQPAAGDVAAIRMFRTAIVSQCAASGREPRATDEAASHWPVRYFVRRLTWHALDHAWEMEDRSIRAPH